MEEPKLTHAERVILANQYRILSFVDKQNADTHETNSEILSRGYTGLYSSIFDGFSEEDPKSVTREVEDVLSMFWVLKNSLAQLHPTEKSQLNLAAFEFEGFDGNHDPHHAQARFIVKRLNLFEEVKSHGMNSHSQATLPKYRRMLAVYNQILNSPEGFTLEGFKRIQAA